MAMKRLELQHVSKDWQRISPLSVGFNKGEHHEKDLTLNY